MERNVCPKTWLTESILVTIFCCLPFGIVGILNANKVSTLFAHGSYEAAVESSNAAAKWTKIGFFLAIVGWILYFILVFVLGATLFSFL